MATAANVTAAQRQYAEAFVKRLCDQYKKSYDVTRGFLKKLAAYRSGKVSRPDLFVFIGQVLALDNEMSSLAGSFVPEAYTPEPFVEARQSDIEEMIDVVRESYTSRPELYRAFIGVVSLFNRNGTPVDALLLEVSAIFADQPHFVQWFNAFMANVASERICIAAGLRDNNDALTEDQINSMTEYRFRQSIRYLLGEQSTQYQSFIRMQRGILDGTVSQTQAMLNAKTLFANRPALLVAFRHHYLAKVVQRRSASGASTSGAGRSGEASSSKAPRR